MNRTAELKISSSARGESSVTLDGVEIAGLVAAEGISIRYVPVFDGGPSVPEVTLTFGPGALTVEFLAELAKAIA